MTSGRLDTLRAIRLFRGQITYPELAGYLRITETNADMRLRRMVRIQLVDKQGLGKNASYSMTRQGRERLAYYEEHLEDVE